MLKARWRRILKQVDYAFQPMVNVLNGEVYGVEALLRKIEKTRYETIDTLFDTAHAKGALYLLDIALFTTALDKFMSIPFAKDLKLFYNFDSRLPYAEDYFETVRDLLTERGCQPDKVCFELNEKHRFDTGIDLYNPMRKAKHVEFATLIDDFGTQSADRNLFYDPGPNYVKLDRFFIAGIDTDATKRSYCSSIVNFAKLLGITVIAKGVETEAEMDVCREIGFSIVQGFFVAKPQLRVKRLLPAYTHLKELYRRDKRSGSEDVERITKEMLHLETIRITDEVSILNKKFSKKLDTNFFPVLDTNDNPLGIIHEKTIKKYIYNIHGQEILKNTSIFKSLHRFITQYPVVDINTPQERILELFLTDKKSEGVIITKNMKYVGFLTSKSLLNIINEKNLAYAREMNPLTKLPGNIVINQFIVNAYDDENTFYYFIYYDFDYFKPFNDKFGFRSGDRVIQLFADIIRKDFDAEHLFAGHVGGDDFFAGAYGREDIIEDVVTLVRESLRKFDEGVATFYNKEEFLKGEYRSTDREGNVRQFPLLTVSAVILCLPKGEERLPQQELSEELGKLKKKAKLLSSDEAKLIIHTLAPAS